MEKVPLLLLALAAGYAVLVISNKQERPLDVLGRVIGGLVLLGAVAGLVCAGICAMKCAKMSCDTGMMKSGCPMTSSENPAPSK